MKDKQYRIGNYIIEDETIYSYGINKKERKLELSDFRVSDDNWSDHWDMIKPIPLTEDLVKKTNLENNNGGYYFKDTHLYLDFSLGRCMLCHFSGDSFRELKYLQELQNVYFCLMEEELIISI